MRYHRVRLPAVVLFLGISSAAFGWGTYGHEQINLAAVEALGDSPLGVCFKRNLDTVERLGITPDFEWKRGARMRGSGPKDSDMEATEGPLHFFEVDAFVKHGQVTPESIALLPNGPFLTELDQYKRLLSANIDWVLVVAPDKPLADPDSPTMEEVAAHGTAPWRAMQLYRMGVDSLRRKDLPMAIFYLSTMAHYIGDMSQPFHATLNYDGQHYDPPARGVHSAFESKILEVAARAVDASFDSDAGLWSSFEATRKQVNAVVQRILGGKAAPVSRKELFGKTLSVTGTGFPYLDPLLEAYSDATNDDGRSTQEMKDFMGTKLDASSPGLSALTVLDAANERLGQGAALVATFWSSAYAEASEKISASDVASCESVSFDADFAVDHYPYPDYFTN